LAGGALPKAYQVVIRVKFQKLAPVQVLYATCRLLE
jgi:hypothetical protein